MTATEKQINTLVDHAKKHGLDHHHSYYAMGANEQIQGASYHPCFGALRRYARDGIKDGVSMPGDLTSYRFPAQPIAIVIGGLKPGFEYISHEESPWKSAFKDTVFDKHGQTNFLILHDTSKTDPTVFINGLMWIRDHSSTLFNGYLKELPIGLAMTLSVLGYSTYNFGDAYNFNTRSLFKHLKYGTPPKISGLADTFFEGGVYHRTNMSLMFSKLGEAIEQFPVDSMKRERTAVSITDWGNCLYPLVINKEFQKSDNTGKKAMILEKWENA